MVEQGHSGAHLKNLMLAVTSRAYPGSADEHNHVPLAAGKYRSMVVKREPACPSSCGCQTCENSERFTMHKEAKLPDGDVIIVVHGFNCTEIGGINTAFHIQDLLYAWNVPLASPQNVHATNGPHLIGFTWPCKHDLFPGYIIDKEGVARFAAFSFANFLLDLHDKNPHRHITIIAHSMGCFLTLKALNMIAVLRGLQDAFEKPLIDEVFWLAPDINASALERTTPDSLKGHQWSRPRHHVRMAQMLRRPQLYTTPSAAEFAAVEQELTQEIQGHPIDGYGYAALDAIGRLHIYSSLHDPAMWVSPIANIGSEESDSADGRIRLGWCGPLHPGLMMLHTGHHHYAVILNECSQLVVDHGAYFFVPAIQRDIAAFIGGWCSRNASKSEAFTLLPPPEKQALAAWHAGGQLQFPAANEPLPAGLQLFSFERAQNGEATLPQAGAPVDQTSQTGQMANSILQRILTGAIRLSVRYYRIGPLFPIRQIPAE